MNDAGSTTAVKVRNYTEPPSRANTQLIRAGILGTGYIADFHAYAIRHTKGVELVSVCDTNAKRAQSFASQWGISKVFDTLSSMLQDQPLDCIHILVPPDHHYSSARLSLEFDVNVLLEKPMCTSVREADELAALARDRELYLGVSHNLSFSGAYKRLREIIRSGALGPLEHLSINNFSELPQIRFGPFDTWMLQAPGNIVLEVGSHLASVLLDLVGVPDKIVAVADCKIKLPGGTDAFRRWHIRATVRYTEVDINIDLRPGFNERTINVHGFLGAAMADLNANTCIAERAGTLDIDLDRFRRSRALARQLRSQARETLVDSALSKLFLRSRGDPYQASILDSVAAFYDGLRVGTALDKRLDWQRGRDVIECCNTIIQAAGIDRHPARKPYVQRTPMTAPTILVFGGTGFIGRELIRQLLAAGFCVRAAVRNSGARLKELDNGNLEIIPVDIQSETDLKRALDGIEFVYHLARADAKSWEQYLQDDVEPTRLIAEACLAANVKRLFYTSSIDPYYAGAKAGTITEDKPLDPNIDRRNYYARAKAAAEAILMEMHRTKGLPVVIYRPGIVIGRGGNPFHWGVGFWPSLGVCQVWGNGTCKLPLVLVADVAQAMVRGIQATGIEGHSYNLVDAPLLTAREFLAELQRIAGMTLEIQYRPIFAFYMIDLIKWVLKLAIRHPDRYRIPSYFDWESRSQRAHFDCSRARQELGWKPASDRQRMIDEGISATLEGILPDRL
jgi:nucleoside-diphosphate-sugar epimerase/predicted dehydrogenase